MNTDTPKILLCAIIATLVVINVANAAGTGQHEILNPDVTGATAVADLPASCRLEADDLTNGRSIFIDCDDVPGLEIAFTGTDTELLMLDLATLGTVQASKVWSSDASLDTILPSGGLLTVASGGGIDLASGSTLDVAGTFEIANVAMTAGAAELNMAADISTNSEVSAATNPLAVGECGKTLSLAHATEFVTTLPAVTLGCKFTFIVGLAPSGANYTIVTVDGAETIKGVAFDMTGGAVSAGAGTAAADTITLVASTALAADRVELWSDGTTWHSIAFSSASGAITFTSAI